MAVTFIGEGIKGEVPRENHQPTEITDKLNHTMLHRVHLTKSGIQTYNVSGDNVPTLLSYHYYYIS